MMKNSWIFRGVQGYEVIMHVSNYGKTECHHNIGRGGLKKNGRSSGYENRKRVEEPEDAIIKVDVKKTKLGKMPCIFYQENIKG